MLAASSNSIDASNLRLVGFAVSSPQQDRGRVEDHAITINKFLRGETVDLRSLPAPQLPVSPVFVDDQGQHFQLVCTSTGMTSQPYRASTLLNSEQVSEGNAGFLPIENLPSSISSAGLGPALSDVNRLSAAAIGLLVGGKGTSQKTGESTGSGWNGLGQVDSSNGMNPSENQTGTHEAETPASSQSPPTVPLGALEQQVLGNSLASLAAGNAFGSTVAQNLLNVPQLGLMAAAQALGGQVQKLFDNWTVDDESGTAEHAAKWAAEKAVSQIQGEVMSQIASQVLPGAAPPAGLMKRLQEFFGGVTSKADLPAAKQADADDMGNTISVLSTPRVAVNGLAAASAISADKMMPASKVILEGSISVVLHQGANWFARQTSKTMVPSKIAAASNVLVGGANPCLIAVSIAKSALEKGQSAETAAKKAGLAQREYDAAIKLGLTEEQANNQAEAAAKKADLTDDQVKALAHLQELTKENDGPLKRGDKVTFQVGENTVTASVLDVHRDSSGYLSATFEMDGQQFLVYRATESFDTFLDSPIEFFKDWGANFAQSLGFVPEQYDLAVSDAAAGMAKYPGLILVGHSLGGGLANYAAGMTGLSAITFNSAALGAGTMGNIVANGVPLNGDLYDHYAIDGDLISGGTASGGLNSVMHPLSGDVHTLPKPNLGDTIGGAQGYEVNVFNNNGIVGAINNHGINNVQNQIGQPGTSISTNPPSYTPQPYIPST